MPGVVRWAFHLPLACCCLLPLARVVYVYVYKLGLIADCPAWSPYPISVALLLQVAEMLPWTEGSVFAYTTRNHNRYASAWSNAAVEWIEISCQVSLMHACC